MSCFKPFWCPKVWTELDHFFLWHQQLQQNLPFSCQDLAPSNLYNGRADSSFSSGSNNALARQMNGETDKWQMYKPHYFPFNLLVVVAEKAKYDHLRAHLCIKYYSNSSELVVCFIKHCKFNWFSFFSFFLTFGMWQPYKLGSQLQWWNSLAVLNWPLKSPAPSQFVFVLFHCPQRHLFSFSILKTNTKTIPKPNTHLDDLTDKSNLEASRFNTVVYVHRMLMLILLMLLIFS